MDNEFMHPQSEHGDGEAAAAPGSVDAAAPVDAAAVIEQVRELLFGDHRRATEGSMKSLEDRLAALTATIEARLADLERRLSESKAEAEKSYGERVEAIGTAFAELGEKIKGLLGKPPA
jgi:hypothetical protein